MNETVQAWLDELAAEPAAALQRLVLGQAAVSAWSRASLREIFIEVFQTHAELLDSALTDWFRDRLLQMPPERTPTVVWASHLQDVLRAMAGLPLPKVAELLRDRFRDFRIWLRPLRSEESLDPEAAYLAALAWAETNQHLEGLWQGLALRRDGEPPYYSDIGLLGLRKTRDESGRLQPKAPFLLLATLLDLADVPGTSRKDWLLTARSLLGGYHYNLETWAREFESVLEARADAKHGPQWINSILPQLRPDRRSLPRVRHDIRPAHSLSETNSIISEVRRHGPAALGATLETFLDRERAYTNTTKNSYFLVRTFNRLAEAARTHDPKWAIARVEEALEWDESNPRNWTVLARCLWARGLRAHTEGDAVKAESDFREALDTLWTARFRFPWDPFVRNELARLHRDAGELDAAEAIYREGIAEFPLDGACRDGLAALLVKTDRLAEAEQLYRETRLLVENDPYSRNGLADILFYRSAANGDPTEREVARGLFQEAVHLQDSYAHSRLGTFDERWQRIAAQGRPRAEVERGSDEAVALPSTAPAKMRPAQRLGRSLLLQWQARHVESPEERERLFAEAKVLLDLPYELTGECRTAFVEARGFLLLARDRPAEARVYFEQQLATFTRRLLGLRLGLAEARARLGETISDEEETELASFGPDGSILLLVLKVIRLLTSTASDEKLRELLLQLYPRVRELTGMPPSESDEAEEDTAAPAAVSTARRGFTPDTMLADVLLASVFRPAAIESSADLQSSESFPRVLSFLQARRDDIFAVAEKLALAA